LRPVTRLRKSADDLVRSGAAALLPLPRARDEVHELATTLNALIKDLRESADREKQMVSDASHELRTPLAVLQAQLELMSAGDRATLDADITSALAATHRMRDLVSELLELSRVEAMGTSGSSDLAALAAELAEAVDRARFGARSDAVVIDFAVSGGGHDFAIGAHDFGRVVDNLVSNAVKAGSMTVRATVVAEPGRLVLTVTDDGPGLPEEFIPRAFDRFSQTDDGREGGTGLGLAIVAAIVAAAGGTVRLDNDGAGARAFVEIPASSDHS
jgi:signal transduction histidine kinase